MNILYKILSGTAVMLLLLTSCVKEQEVTMGKDENATITISTATRADNAGDAEDRYINSLRVLGYNTTDGQLAFNEEVFGITTASTANEETFEKTVNVKTGKFTVVFIANEHKTPATSAMLSGISPSSNNNISYLRNTVSFPHEAFANDKDIPMVTIKENIIIQGDNMVIDPGSSTPSAVLNKWPVAMERLGIRIDLTLKLTAAQVTEWTNDNGKIYFTNVPEEVFIFPETDNSGAFLPADKEYSVSLTPTGTEGGLSVYKLSRIILPESSFTDLTKANALTLKLKEGALTRLGAISAGTGTKYGTNGYTLPRNTYLGITAEIGETSLTFTINVMDWVDEDMNHVLN